MVAGRDASQVYGVRRKKTAAQVGTMGVVASTTHGE
jgi:hypothetical protein